MPESSAASPSASGLCAKCSRPVSVASGTCYYCREVPKEKEAELTLLALDLERKAEKEAEAAKTEGSLIFIAVFLAAVTCLGMILAAGSGTLSPSDRVLSGMFALSAAFVAFFLFRGSLAFICLSSIFNVCAVLHSFMLIMPMQKGAPPVSKMVSFSCYGVIFSAGLSAAALGFLAYLIWKRDKAPN
ncbi:MAG: hypothetical protein RL095_1662 [Verrucomicrobiota bacterium]|jgi:hypothetical protein